MGRSEEFRARENAQIHASQVSQGRGATAVGSRITCSTCAIRQLTPRAKRRGEHVSQASDVSLARVRHEEKAT